MMGVLQKAELVCYIQTVCLHFHPNADDKVWVF